MRIPDSLLQTNFMNNLYKSRTDLAKIQTQLATQSKVNKPSDNPLGNARIMRMQEQLSSVYTYQSNVSYAQSIIDDSILSMESMSIEIQNVQSYLTQLNSGIVNDDLSSFAESIDASLEIMLDLANSEFNGQYNFAGTEGNLKPFSYDSANNRVTANSDHIGNDRVVKISSNITQKINITGQELFQSVFSQTGNLDATAGVGVPQVNSGTIYDSTGNEYTLNLSYSMTADNTYNLNYSIQDSDGDTVVDENVNDIVFNSLTGEIESIDGEKFTNIHVVDETSKLDFMIELSGTTEQNSAASFTNNLNQKADIFNVLIDIRDSLANGEKPTEEQVEMVNDFYQHLLNKSSKAGGISNKLQAQEEILINQEVELSNLLSLEKDVDMYEALMNLENAQYYLDISYKISSTILPKSLVDYM